MKPRPNDVPWKKVHPVGERLFIRPGEVTDRIGSIWIPESAERQCTHGEVVDAGPDARGVKVGDHVIYRLYSGDKITVDGDALLILTPKDVVAVVLSEAEIEVLDA